MVQVSWWLIGNGEDINLAQSNGTCDRVIVTAGLREDCAKEAAKYLPISVSDSEWYDISNKIEGED
jgi:hypothetical protein